MVESTDGAWAAQEMIYMHWEFALAKHGLPVLQVCSDTQSRRTLQSHAGVRKEGRVHNAIISQTLGLSPGPSTELHTPNDVVKQPN